MLKELDLKLQAQLTAKPHAYPHYDTTPLWPAKSSSLSMTASQRGFETASPDRPSLKQGNVSREAPFQMITCEDSNPETRMVWFLKSAFSTTIEKVEISTW